MEIPAPILAFFLEGTDIYRLGSYRRVCRNWRQAIDGYMTPIILSRFPHMLPYHIDGNPWWMAARQWVPLRLKPDAKWIISAPVAQRCRPFPTAMRSAGNDSIWIAYEYRQRSDFATLVKQNLATGRCLRRIELGSMRPPIVRLHVIESTVICWRVSGSICLVDANNQIKRLPNGINSKIFSGDIAILSEEKNAVQIHQLGSPPQLTQSISLAENGGDYIFRQYAVDLTKQLVFVSSGEACSVDIYSRNEGVRLRTWQSQSIPHLCMLSLGILSHPWDGGSVTIHSSTTGSPLRKHIEYALRVTEEAGRIFAWDNAKSKTLVLNHLGVPIGEFEQYGLIDLTASDGLRIASVRRLQYGTAVLLWRIIQDGITRIGEYFVDNHDIESLCFTPKHLVIGQNRWHAGPARAQVVVLPLG